MVDFINGVFPFVIIVVCIAIIVVHYRKMGKKETDREYLVEGMCLGMCIGVAVSTSMHFNMGIGISLGMLVGETIGILVKKE